MGFDHFDCSVPGDRAVPEYAPQRRRRARPAVGAWRSVCAAWERERASGRRRRAGAAFVAVTLVASSLALSGGDAGAQESDDSPSPESPPAGVRAEPPKTASGGWWDGSGGLAAARPTVVEEGRCDSYGGSLGLFAGGAVAKVCPSGAATDPGGGPLSGSPRGVGWFEGFDADGLDVDGLYPDGPDGDGSPANRPDPDDSSLAGPYAGVELFGAPGITAATYRTLGALDVVFDGGTFSASFSECTHRAEAGYSSCVTRVPGASLPPGAFVGIATPGTEPRARAPRGIEGTATPAAERAALVALYNATDGPNWHYNTNWNTTEPVSTWSGVTTNDAGSVTHLYLFLNGLSGSIPAELGDLTNLEYLSLGSNSLSGSIPAELGDLTNLELLSLGSNDLSGSIPAELGDLTNLERLYLSWNGLSGSVPAELGDLTNLRWLWLGGNGLSGSIPAWLSDLTNLEYLSLRFNDLSGSIPAELGDLTNLRWLDLGGNGLSGSIPAELGDLTNLEYLSLGGNDLSGSIPAELGDLTNLERLELSGNGLSGSIPVELGDLTNLRGLDLGGNGLSGSIPAELGDLTNLERLDLSWNGLSGSIPAELGDLTNLYALDLGGNGLSGSIPAELGDLTNLTWLSLSFNGLSGSIPAELGDLTNLRWLNLRYNDLSGSIPAALGDLTNLRVLSLGSNGLSGSIPAELGDLTNLERLDLSWNGLSGSIPAELGDLTNLRTLDLSFNGLSGSIPAELGDLTNLERLYLHRNSLSGSIPAELGELTNLRWLWLHNNDLSGCVPAALSAVRSIRFDAGLSYCGVLELLVAVLVGAAVVELVYNSDLDGFSTPALSAFSVSAGGASRTISSVSVAGRVVTLTLGSPVAATQTVTVSYTAPTADAARIESTGGDAAEGFTDEPVTIPPDPPTITGAESTTGGLTVTWTPVADISGYDVEWRPDAEQAWQSTRIDQQQHTISDLTDGALYWVRVRAVKTDGELTGQTLYTTAWSQPEPAIAGDWTPQNLQVMPGDSSLELTWDTVAGADDYDVRYVPEAGGGGAVTRSARAARAVATDDFAAARSALAVLSDDGSAARAAVTGLDNGTTYDVQVRAQRTVTSPSGAVTLSSTPASTKGTPAVAFLVAEASGPRVVRSGGNVSWTLELKYLPVPPRPDPLLEDLYPFANRSMGAWILAGPSVGQSVRCRSTVAPAPEIVISHGASTGDAPRVPCVTDAEGRMTLVYTSVAPSSDYVGNTDHVRLYVDPNENRQRDPGEPYVDLDPSVTIVRPINYAALGDSYSAGEHGELTDVRPADDPFRGTYLDEECRRWTLAYPWLIAGSPNYSSIGFFACTGAVTSDVYVPAGIGNFNGQSSSLNTLNTGLGLGSQQAVDMVTITIGGNDIGFADGINDCFQLEGCDLGSLKTSIDQVKVELRKVLSGLKAAAPHASIFVLGYPQLIPSDSIGSCRALNLDSVVREVNDGFPKNAGFNFGNSFRRTFLNNFGLGFVLGISGGERQFLRDTAVDLNMAISGVAGEKGAHFVAVAGEFAGHEPCGGEEAWLYGVVAERVDADVVDSPNALPFSDRSFHPNAAGHREYARILRDYIEGALRGPGGVNRAGLPRNPPAVAAQRENAGSSRGAAAARATEEGPRSTSKSDAAASAASAGSGTGFLWARRVVAAASACAAPLAPGERVELFAAGFAPDAVVSFSVLGVSVPAVGVTSVVALSPAPTIPAATADASGRLEVTWTIPDAPAPDVDEAPRAYVVEASSTDRSGEIAAARSVAPLLVYPGVAPCAVEDTASTSLGRPVRVAILANDVAPAGGSLDPGSVTVEPVDGGSFVVDGSDGSLTFTPDPGFAGTITTRYVVYDGWDIGVSAAVTITVDAGCTVTGAADATVIEGTDGDDVICVGDPDDWDAFHVIDAKAGDDVIVGGDGVDWIYGGAGQDVVYGRDGADSIDGGTGVDTIHGGRDFDTIHSADLADTIIDDADGYELLLTASTPTAHVAPVATDDAAHTSPAETADIAVLDNDHDPNENLVVTSLSITRAPTLGTAHVVVSASGEVAVRYVAGDSGGVDSFTYQVCDTLDACTTAEVTVTVATAGCTIVGTDGDDTLSGTAGADVICGLGGDDTIYGLEGDDVLVGGPGDDRLYGGDETNVGDDGSDTLFGGPGDDRLFGGAGADTLWGGPGGDALAGNRGDDVLVGGAGNDFAVGGGEDDVLWGGAGDDNLDGHAGDDTLHGGAGRDILSGGDGDDVLFGDGGNDQLTGGSGADTLWGGADIDLLWGNTQDDTLHGGAGIDILRGGGGDDRLSGGAGDDQLHGNAGDDRLWGDTGGDSLDGGNGRDYVDGGEDTDRCTRGERSARCEA